MLHSTLKGWDHGRESSYEAPSFLKLGAPMKYVLFFDCQGKSSMDHCLCDEGNGYNCQVFQETKKAFFVSISLKPQAAETDGSIVNQ